VSEPWRLLALPDLPAEALAGGFAADPGLTLVPLASRDREGLLAALGEAEIVLADWSTTTWMDADAFAAAPHLAFVQQPSVGTDKIDLDAAAKHGVPVSNAGGANAVSVAEWCLTAALVLRRQVFTAERALAAGGWPQTTLAIRDLAGARVGILGLGTIGRLTADRFAALGCDVAYWSRTEKDVPYARHEPAELAARSDVLVCLLPGAEGTRHLVDAELLARLPDGAVVVSAGRGSVVDEAALVTALAGKRISAGLDVYETEPLPADSPLRSLPNVLLSPHTAGSSREAQLAIVAACQRNLAAVAAGRTVADVVNGVDPQVRRR
jgi:phosphoglycerate dehydrogenase-like enzyme